MRNFEVSGEIRQKRCEIEFEWKITDFSKLSDQADAEYRSPVFSFSDSCWFVRIYPNGESREYEGYIGLFLIRLNDGPKQPISWDVKFRSADGNHIRLGSGKHDFRKSGRGWGDPKAFTRSELLRRKSNILPSDVLTIIYTMKNAEPHTFQVSLFWRMLKACRDFKRILDKRKRSDVVLKLDGRKFRAHKAILETRSRVFAAMFRHDMAESKTGVITITDTPEDALECVLSYIYSGLADGLTTENASAVYMAADKYDLQELKKLCLAFMEENITADMVCDLIVISDTYGETKLKQFSKEYFIQNTTSVLESEKWKRFSNENPLIANQFFESIFKERRSL